MPNPTVPQVMSVYPYDSYDFGSGLPVLTRAGVTVAVQGTLDALVTAAAAAGVQLYFGTPAGQPNPDYNISTAAQSLTPAKQLQALQNIGLETPTAVPYAAAITPNADTTDFVNVAQLTGALTVNAPSGTPHDGQELLFRFIQDATGRVITWNAAYAFGTDFPSANVPSTANAKFEVKFRYNATDAKWRCISILRGF